MYLNKNNDDIRLRLIHGVKEQYYSCSIFLHMGGYYGIKRDC